MFQSVFIIFHHMLILRTCTHIEGELKRGTGASEELWLNLQNQYDLYQIKARRMKILRNIKPYRELHKQAV